ncbi:MAG TPA: 2-dehydro-3-deoxygalactonokinase [Acetobacteraceae bacterium]|jgi:2-dehydro-3-deoxygalactonokinase|nr:2-dehydro-3-deoxygalactonokinase [Acetobacteraceae bacterium]
MIGVDWGTTAFRAFRITRDGTIRDRRAGPRGILNVPNNRFAETLREEVGPWLAAGEDHVLLSGMIGSRQGWKEAPYLPCPAGAAEIAATLTDIPFDWGQVKLVPGLATDDPAGVPEVMRGEETQIIGCLAAIGGAGVACLPGSHSKWARIEAGRVAGFTTHLTGEAYAALRGHTILGRMMHDGATSPAAFDQGVARAADADGLLHHVFGARTLALTGRMAESDTASYLSGILIGHEVRAALGAQAGAVVQLIGTLELTALYARAIAACGCYAERHDGDAAAHGLAAIGAHAAWS